MFLERPLRDRYIGNVEGRGLYLGEADVIVCLGGRDRRIMWAAELYHRKLAPVVVVSNKPGAAEAMRYRLIQSGVNEEDAWVDNRSHRTADHPAGIAALDGIDPKTQRFLIVTDPEHSRRAAACFRKAGYQHFTVSAGVSTGAIDKSKPRWRDRVMLLPYLAYEYAGLVQYWWRGHI